MPPVRIVVLGVTAVSLLMWYLVVSPSTGYSPRFEYNLERANR